MRRCRPLVFLLEPFPRLLQVKECRVGVVVEVDVEHAPEFFRGLFFELFRGKVISIFLKICDFV